MALLEVFQCEVDDALTRSDCRDRHRSEGNVPSPFSVGSDPIFFGDAHVRELDVCHMQDGVKDAEPDEQSPHWRRRRILRRQ